MAVPATDSFWHVGVVCKQILKTIKTYINHTYLKIVSSRELKVKYIELEFKKMAAIRKKMGHH